MTARGKDARMTAVTSSTPGEEERKLSQRHSWIAFALAGIAGSVDAIGYLLLGKIFTSHMSGNTVAMAMPVATKNWAESWRHFEPIIAFFVGVVLGLAAVDALARMKASRLFGIIACAEIALLLAFLLVSHPAPQWAVVLPAGALGAQNALLRRVGHHNVRTTFVTGMLTDTARGIVDTVSCVFSRDPAEAMKKLRDFAFYGGIWCSFAGGGVAGAALAAGHRELALLLPIFGLSVLVVCDAIHPFAESKEE